MINWQTHIRIDDTPMEWTGQPTPCQIWLGAVTPAGYGALPGRVNGEQAAHRAHFKLNGGMIPAGHELDHTCRVRICVAHLEAVTPTENKRRGNSMAGVGRGERIDHRAASLAAQAGDWARYRELARIDEGPLPLAPLRLTPGLARRWVEALRSDPFIDGPGTEGEMYPRTANDVLAHEMPGKTAERVRRELRTDDPRRGRPGALQAHRRAGGRRGAARDRRDPGGRHDLRRAGRGDRRGVRWGGHPVLIVLGLAVLFVGVQLVYFHRALARRDHEAQAVRRTLDG
ncbi:hypothetical protein [Amycolatopsis sp. cmx-8-4]|uniref:hypothetical protein n=1 Tax=Amycolatopsis sp. cmx-8-4 TaxID=2790947 RepID=UPI00397B5EDF